MQEAIHRGVAPMVIVAAFKKSGIHPLNPEIVHSILPDRKEGVEDFWKKKEERRGRIDKRMLTDEEVIQRFSAPPFPSSAEEGLGDLTEVKEPKEQTEESIPVVDFDGIVKQVVLVQENEKREQIRRSSRIAAR
jgi:hypothetical protein